MTLNDQFHFHLLWSVNEGARRLQPAERIASQWAINKNRLFSCTPIVNRIVNHVMWHTLHADYAKFAFLFAHSKTVKIANIFTRRHMPQLSYAFAQKKNGWPKIFFSPFRHFLYPFIIPRSMFPRKHNNCSRREIIHVRKIVFDVIF